jgi:hypothetical protein
MVLASDRSVPGVAAARAELLVQHVVGKLDGVQRVEAPVLFRVDLRVRVLDRETVGGCRVERRALSVGQPRREVRFSSGVRNVFPSAVDEVHGVVLKVVNAHTAALVGIGDGAAVFEAPLPRGGDGTVDPAGTRGGRGDDARIVRIERVRHLHHHGDVGPAGPVVVVGEPFLAADLS